MDILTRADEVIDKRFRHVRFGSASPLGADVIRFAYFF